MGIHQVLILYNTTENNFNLHWYWIGIKNILYGIESLLKVASVFIFAICSLLK